MKQYKICVYAIAKDEAAFCDRFMDSVREADKVCVLDTGSADATAGLLRARGAHVESARLTPFRFDEARNMALALVPEDADICVSLDLDEVFEPGWRQILEHAWREGQTRAEYSFVYDHDASGAPRTIYTSQKIHARHGYRWAHPVHEVLEYQGEESISFIPGIVIHHYPDDRKPRTQYLPLLELSHAENPDDDRTAFWLGREYFFHGMYDKCADQLMKHLALPSARWDEERSASMRFVAESFHKRGNADQARAWHYRAIAECPRLREPYLHMIRFAYNMGEWPLLFCMADMALRISQRSTSYLAEAEAWGSEIHDLGSIACYRLGMYQRAREWAEAALAADPQNARLRENHRLIAEKAGEG